MPKRKYKVGKYRDQRVRRSQSNCRFICGEKLVFNNGQYVLGGVWVDHNQAKLLGLNVAVPLIIQ